MNADLIGFSNCKKGEQECRYCKLECIDKTLSGCFLYLPNNCTQVLLYGVKTSSIISFRVGEVIQ